MAQSYLLKDPRTGTYIYRKMVPLDLRASFGKREIRRSLRTKSPSEARVRCLEVALEIENQLNQFRQQSAKTEAEIAAMAMAWFRDRYFPEGRDFSTLDVLIRTEDELTAATTEWLAKTDQRLSPFDYDRFWHRCLRANCENLGTMGGMTPLREKYFELYPRIAPKQEKVIKLSELAKLWADERQPGIDAVRAMDVVTGRFIKEFGDWDIKKITKDMVRGFKDMYLKIPRSITKADRELDLPISELIDKQPEGYKRITIRTVNNSIATLVTLFKWANNQGFMEGNPAVGLSVRDKKVRKARIAYTPDDMKAIFAELSKFRHKPSVSERYWIPLVAMYTGCRLEEIGQSVKADLKKEGDIYYIDIHNEGVDRSVKNLSSIRKVPLHPDLVASGFLDYAHMLPADSKLFPNLKFDKHSQTWTKIFSQWYNPYIKRKVLTDPRKSFHSFRHAYKERCREAKVFKETHDALTGHVPTDESGGYGEYPLPVLAEAVYSLRFPSISEN